MMTFAEAQNVRDALVTLGIPYHGLFVYEGVTPNSQGYPKFEVNDPGQRTFTPDERHKVWYIENVYSRAEEGGREEGSDVAQIQAKFAMDGATMSDFTETYADLEKGKGDPTAAILNWPAVKTAIDWQLTQAGRAMGA